MVLRAPREIRHRMRRRAVFSQPRRFNLPTAWRSHAWAFIPEGTGKMVGAFHPAGSFEQFVEETAKLGGRATQELMQKHGMSFGPAIDVANLKRPK